MMTWLFASLFLMVEPHCSLFAGTQHIQGRGTLTKNDVVAVAASRSEYTLRADSQEVAAQAFGTPALMSLTWQRPAETFAVSFTCTQKRNQPHGSDGSMPYVVCTQGLSEPIWGKGALSVRTDGLQMTVSATSSELRISTSDPQLGFVAAWRERSGPSLTPLMLSVGVQNMLCLVL